MLRKLPKKRVWLVLAGVGLVVFANSLFNSFVWDDEQFIVKNQYVQQFAVGKIFSTNTIAGASQHSNYYRPLTTLSFALDYQLWQLHPFGYHLTNTCLHIAAGIVLFYLLTTLALPSGGAFWLSLIFLVQPLQTEAVVYANSRGDSLYALMALLGLLCFAISFKRKLPQFKWGERVYQFRQRWLLGLSWLFYVLAILAKEIGLATLGLYVLVWAQKTQFNKKNLRQYYSQLQLLLTLIFSAGIYLLLRASVLNFGSSFNFYEGTNHYTQSLAVRLLTFGNTLWTYFRLLLLPVSLHMERTVPIIEYINLAVIGVVVLVVLVIFLGYLERQRKQTNWMWLGLVWFMTMMAPVSGIIPINGLIYEHWLYLPLVGFLLIMYGLINLLAWTNWPSWKYLLGVYVLILSLLTVRQNYFWAKPSRFYEYTLRFAQSARLHNNLGMAYADEGKLDKSVAEYRRAIELGGNYPQTFHNLGNSYVALGQYGVAEAAFKQAVEIDEDFIFSYPTLINLLLQQKRLAETVPYFKKLIQLAPQNIGVRKKYQQVLLELEKL